MGRRPPPEELGPFQFAVLVLSLALLLGLAAEWLLPVPEEVSRLVFYIDTAVCVVLFIDFSVRFRRADSKLAFMKWGWLDLLASVPAVDALRFGRLFRIVRVLRMVVAIRSLKRLLELVWASKSQAGVAAVFVIAFLVVSFGSVGVLLAERTEEANIKTAEDALWWSMTTVTTVGYGDHYPVTNAGRVIATLLMISGIGIFGTLSGVAAGIFLGDKKTEPASRNAQREILDHIDALERELAELRAARSSGDHPSSKSQAPPLA
jgi:voltage-gated potassium channel